MSLNTPLSDRAKVIGKFNELSKDERLAVMKRMMRQMGKSRPLMEIEIIHKSRMGVPLGIFSQDSLSCLEAIVKFLRESKSMRLGAIAKLLNRDNRTIWATYANARRKMPEPLSAEGEEMPASLIADRKLSTLEHVVSYAKTLGKTNHEVALLLHLDDRTIWSAYDKAKRKQRGEGKQ